MFIGQPSPACRHHDQQNCLLGNHRLCLDLLRGLYRSRHELNGLKNKQDLKFLFRHYGTIQRTNRQLGFTFDSQNAFYFAIVVSVFYSYIDILVYIIFKSSPNQNANLYIGCCFPTIS